MGVELGEAVITTGFVTTEEAAAGLHALNIKSRPDNKTKPAGEKSLPFEM